MNIYVCYFSFLSAFQNPVVEVVGILWMFFQPLLFGLIASAVQLDRLSAETVGQLSVLLFFFYNFLMILMQAWLQQAVVVADR